MGEGLALLSATFFAASNVAVVKAADAKGDRGATLSVVITMAISALVWMTFEGGALPDPAQPAFVEGVLWFAVGGVFAMALGRAFVFVSLRRLGATRAAAVKRLNPFFSVVLAFVLLGETIAPLGVAGMALIALSFAILFRRAWAGRGMLGGETPPPGDYAWGVAAAFWYAASYVARKLGLAAIPLAAFGTMVSAVAGFLAITALALFIPRFRQNLRDMFRNATPWVVAAGVLISFGQIAMFAALFHETVATVVMISSLEIFISNFLSVAVFRTEARAHSSTVLASVLATLGVIAVAAT